MNLFIMYMSGNTISIFPIMMVCMMAWRPIQALMSMSASRCPEQTPFWVVTVTWPPKQFICAYFVLSAFKLLESSSQQWLQGLVYLIGNLLGSALAIYKCQSMGLLPTHSSDWLAFIEPPQVNELSDCVIFLLIVHFFCCIFKFWPAVGSVRAIIITFRTNFSFL